MQSEVWKAARVRVAQLTHPEVVNRLFAYYRFLGSVRQLAEGWKAQDDPFVSPTVVFDRQGFAEKDVGEALDKHAPLRLSNPVDAFFAREERRAKRKGR